MNRIALIAVALMLAAGCAAKKQIVLPMRQPARVAVPGSIRTLLFEDVKEQRGAVPGGYSADKESNATLVKAMMSSEFSGSSYAILNDELLEMVKKTGKAPKYMSDGPTVAADFLSQMIGDPGSIGIVEVEVTTSFGDAFTVENREIALTTTQFNPGGGNRPVVRTERISVHRIDVVGSVSAVVRIRSPYPDGKPVFEEKYDLPDFRYSSVEAAPSNRTFFGRGQAANQGNGAPTLTEVKAIQFKKLAEQFFKDICPSTKEVNVQLDSRGDKMAYNLLAEGAFPWAEMRLRKIGGAGKPEEQAANLYNLGISWEAQGLVAEAVTKYKAALDIEPGNGLFRRAHERASSQSSGK